MGGYGGVGSVSVGVGGGGLGVMEEEVGEGEVVFEVKMVSLEGEDDRYELIGEGYV